METRIDTELDGLSPFFEYADMVFYITRGRKLKDGIQPISMDEWLAHIQENPGLILDETYEQHNPNRLTIEVWREIGRSRWVDASEPDWFHFSHARIEYIHGSRYKGGPAGSKAGKIWKSLGPNPTLEQWVEYIASDRSMRPVDEYVLDDEKVTFAEPGLALWRYGGKERLFRYIPSSIWIYIAPTGSFHKGDPAPDPHREQKCREIASALSAKVCLGRNGL